MKRSILWAGALVLIGAGAAIFASQNGWFNSETPDYVTIPSDTFAKVVLVHDPEASSAMAQLIFPSGEMQNPYAEGLAHYLEHLVWINTFQGDGNGRHSNAWTSLYATAYFKRVANGDLEDILSQLSAVANPITLDETFALEERQIVLREHGFRVAESPLYDTLREVEKTLFGDLAFARSVIGVPSDIAEFSLEDAKALHKVSHQLGAATLLLTGNITKRQAEKALRDLPVSPVLETVAASPPTPLPPLLDETEVSVPKREDPFFIYRKLLPLPECGTPARCGVLLRLANKSVDSTLPEGIGGPLRFDAFITRSFNVSIYQLDETQMMVSFNAVPDAGISLDEVQEVFQKAITKTFANGLSEDTFERLKKREVDDLESVSDFPDFNADTVGRQLSVNAPLYGFTDVEAALNSVTREELNSFLAALNAPGRVVIRHVNSEN